MPVKGPDGEPLLGRSTTVTVHLSDDDWWTGHRDETVDVAVAPLVPVVNKVDEIGSPPHCRAIGRELIPTIVEVEELDAIGPVMFAGYPAGIRDTHNFTPVVRQGMTASRLQLDC